MGRSRSGTRSGLAMAAALFLGGAVPWAEAQASPDAPPPHKSVYGKLERVDKTVSAIVMKSEAGESLAWKFDAAVIAEAEHFKPGDPMIVIYRQLAHNAKRVTALAFPGAAKAPTYVNMTGERVVLRSAPAVDGVCGKAGASPVTESAIPAGGLAEVLEACWCCASSGETCTPGTKSGLGRALLVQCFK